MAIRAVKKHSRVSTWWLAPGRVGGGKNGAREGQKLFLLAHDRRAPCVCLLTSCCVTSCFMFRYFVPAATSDQQITHQRGFVTRLIYLGWVIGFLAFASSISLVMDYCKELRKIIQPPPGTRFREPVISKVKKGGTHSENGGGFGKEISRRDRK